jgi:hypothetical protein
LAETADDARLMGWTPFVDGEAGESLDVQTVFEGRHQVANANGTISSQRGRCRYSFRAWKPAQASPANDVHCTKYVP